MSAGAVNIQWGRPVTLHAAHHGEWRKRVLRDAGLTDSARLVAMIILEGINWGRDPKLRHKAGTTWQTQEAIMTALGYKESTVRRAFRALEHRGWIGITARSGGRANATRLMWPALMPDRSAVTGQSVDESAPDRAPTGQFAPRSAVTSDRSDRSAVTGNLPEDHLENFSEAQETPENGLAAALRDLGDRVDRAHAGEAERAAAAQGFSGVYGPAPEGAKARHGRGKVEQRDPVTSRPAVRSQPNPRR